jgi:hypothetical protein
MASVKATSFNRKDPPRNAYPDDLHQNKPKVNRDNQSRNSLLNSIIISVIEIIDSIIISIIVIGLREESQKKVAGFEDNLLPGNVVVAFGSLLSP